MSKRFAPFQPSNPSWWAMAASLFLSSFSIQSFHSGAVQAVVAGGTSLVVATYTVQHHKTIRNADTAAATIRAAALQSIQTARSRAAAQTPSSGAPQ